jgi:hypothetical protein
MARDGDRFPARRKARFARVANRRMVIPESSKPADQIMQRIDVGQTGDLFPAGSLDCVTRSRFFAPTFAQKYRL